MRWFTLKGAYFAVTTLITMSIIAGGLAIIIMNEDTPNVIWAQQLIGMVVASWVPSPAENLKDILADSAKEEDDTTKQKVNKETNNTTTKTTDTTGVIVQLKQPLEKQHLLEKTQMYQSMSPLEDVEMGHTQLSEKFNPTGE